MKTYNLIGYSIILTYMLACMYFAPAHLGPWAGLLIGAAYFLFCWSVCGVYLADILHLGIAHRSLDYKEWFMKAVTVVNNSFGLYVDPISWVNRHRLHHKHADHAGDPNKLDGDGFWQTLYLCLMPYQCIDNLATDEILRSRTFRGRGESRLCDHCASLEFLSLLEAGWGSDVCAGDVGWNASVCRVGQYDSKLLDPHPNIWIPAISR
jgi:hypothetical protein